MFRHNRLNTFERPWKRPHQHASTDAENKAETGPQQESDTAANEEHEKSEPQGSSNETHPAVLPVHHSSHGLHQWRKRVKRDGESGRKGFHPLHFPRICFKSSSRPSMVLNLLWPIVPAAIAVHFAIPDQHVVIFALNYVAMVPSANLLGFAGQELARKLPVVLGMLLETVLGSVVEIILFSVLIARGEGNVPVIRAAILGSILANVLLCLGACFIAGGLFRREQHFHEVVSEVGSELLFVAAIGLITPAAFGTLAANSSQASTSELPPDIQRRVLDVSRGTAIVLLIAFGFFVFFQISSHHSIYKDILEADEEQDEDRHHDLTKPKLTFIECIIAICISLACVSMIAVFLVSEIEYLVNNQSVSDAFLGLILIPVVEKFGEHITAIDEAYDNKPNAALSHILNSSIMTALFNTPLVVIIGWGLHRGMDLNFRHFEAIVLILSIICVGNFLRDQKSNYLEGVLCVLVYVIIAVCAFFYPSFEAHNGTLEGGA